MPSDLSSVRRPVIPDDGSGINPFSAAAIADPYPIYTQLRERAPILWFEPWGLWIVSRHADVVRILKDPRYSVERFKSVRLGPTAPSATVKVFDIFAQQMLSSDAPAHQRHRGLVNKAFTPRVIEEMRPRIQALVNELIDNVIETGRMEVIHELAYPLPVTVIAEMLGVPASDRALFKHWSDQAVIFLDGTSTVADDQALLHSVDELAQYLRPRIADARLNPRNNLLSNLTQVRDSGDALSEDEIISNCLLLLAAGHETTTNLIGNGLYALLQNPDELKRLRKNPALTESATDEMLRYDSPVQWTDRIAKEDIEFDGHTFRKWDNVHIALGAANRDPAQFNDPDRVDVGRQDNKHVAFGHGPHFCLGAALARLEGQIAFRTMLDSLANIQLADETITRSGNHAFRRLNALHVTFTPASKVA